MLDIFLHDDQHYTVKIGDFGLATVKTHYNERGEKMRQPTGSILWMVRVVVSVCLTLNKY